MRKLSISEQTKELLDAMDQESFDKVWDGIVALGMQGPEAEEFKEQIKGELKVEESIDDLIQKLASVNPKLADEVQKSLIDALRIMVERNVKMGYKESFASMGLHGAIFQIIHKAERLKNSLLDNDGKGFNRTAKEIINDSLIPNVGPHTLNRNEGPYAHILDCFNYSLLTMCLFKRYTENKDGR